MSEHKPCRTDLMNQINEVSFALDDTRLFLNTHPCNQEALAFFEEYNCQRVSALKEYAKHFGPLTTDTMSTSEDYWKWIREPWPWQKGGC